jgi:coenzyme F420-reducing hydrogenase beta subunit
MTSEMFLPLVKRSEGFDALKERIIDKGFCTYCGACASFCEHIVLKEIPELVEDCSMKYDDVIKCGDNGICYDVCPMTETNDKELEEAFLEGKSDAELGIVRKLTAGSCSLQGQDGGVVTSLLLTGMKKGIFDCAIVAARGSGFRAEPIIAKSEEEITEAMGTKYVAAPMVSKIGEAIKEGRKKIAIVGTPCEIRATRKLQQAMLKEVEGIYIIAIGLFCLKSFDYDLLSEKTMELLGIELGTAEKVQISRGRYIVRSNGKEKSCKVTALEDAFRNNCYYCEDFTARLADISVGSTGSTDGYSTVIIRSKKGEELFNSLEDFVPTDVDREGIIRIASFKGGKLKREGEVPPILRL